MNSVSMLSEILRSSGARIRFGLEAQGYIPTVEAMLALGSTWAEIGSAIGWHGPTVERFYSMYLERRKGGAA